MNRTALGLHGQQEVFNQLQTPSSIILGSGLGVCVTYDCSISYKLHRQPLLKPFNEPSVRPVDLEAKRSTMSEHV